MSLDCPTHELLLRLSEPELFDDPSEADEVAARVAGCPDCASAQRLFQEGLAPPPPPFDPLELLPALREQLSEIEAAPSADPARIGVRLVCAYCKDRLASDEAVYCAECLTPHHGECYVDHGRCVALGCGATSVVGAVALPAPRREGRARLMIGALGALTLGAAAAWGAGSFERTGEASVARPAQGEALERALERAERESSRERGGSLSPLLSPLPLDGPSRAAPSASPADESPASPTDSPAPPEGDSPSSPEDNGATPGASGARRYTLASYPAGDLVRAEAKPSRPEWEAQYAQRLRAQQVSLNFSETPLRDAIDFLRDITGLNVNLAPNAADRLERSVYLRLRNCPLTDALEVLTQQVELRWSLVHGTIYLQPSDAADRRLAPESWPLAEPDGPAQGAALIAEIRSATRAELGQAGWADPAAIRYAEGLLRVRQTAPGHAAVRRFLASKRPAPLPAPLADAWFAPRPPGTLPPAALQTRLHATRLLERTSLSAKGNVARAVALLAEGCPVRIRLDSSARELVTAAPVDLSLRDVTYRDALNLVCASEPRLVWEVDRWGVLLRSTRGLSLEARLKRAAERALLLTSATELRRQTESRLLTVNFDRTPLSEVIDFLRDISGFNIVVANEARPHVEGHEVTLRREQAPFQQVFDQVLRNNGLGLNLHQGTIQIVLRANASEGPEQRLRREEFLRTGFGGPRKGVTLYELAEALEEAAPCIVVLERSVVGCAARFFVPEGRSLRQVLELLRAQGGVEGHLAWLSEEARFALVFSRGHRASLSDALVRATSISPWPDPPPAAERAWGRRIATLEAALRELARSEGEQLAARTEAALSAAACADELSYAHRWLCAPDGLRAQERLLRTTRLHAARLRSLRARAREVALERREPSLRERVAAIEAELRALPEERRLGAEGKALGEKRDELQTEVARKDRDAALEEARLQHEARRLLERLRQICVLPLRVEEGRRLRERLALGAPVDELFPQGFSRWSREGTYADAARLSAGLDRVGAQEGGGLTLAGVPIAVGDRVEGVEVRDELTLIDLAGRALLAVEAGLAVRVELKRASGEAVQVELRAAKPAPAEPVAPGAPAK